MAKQNGIIPLNGTIGNITFYQSKDGYLARKKNGVNANRIANDPAFQRTRENGAEFGRAGAAGKILRAAFRTLLQQASDPKMVSRLTREMMKVIQADTTNTRGQRNVLDGETELLTGFEFNENGKLNASLYAPYTATIDRASGQLKIDMASFIPVDLITAPAGATHFQIVSAGAEIDFEGKTYISDFQSSAVLPWDATPAAAISLTNAVTANSTHPLFLVLGITFSQEVNGSKYSLKTGAFNALALVKVNGA